MCGCGALPAQPAMAQRAVNERGKHLPCQEVKVKVRLAVIWDHIGPKRKTTPPLYFITSFSLSRKRFLVSYLHLNIYIYEYIELALELNNDSVLL